MTAAGYRSAVVSLALGLAAIGPALAQSPAYRAQADTLYYEGSNPFRMFWLRGSDTVGPPRLERSVDRHVWSEDSAGLSVLVQSLALNVGRDLSRRTYALSRDGRIRLIDGVPPDINARMDLVPRLPRQQLRAGLVWSDTLVNEGHGAGGFQTLRLERSYRVDRMSDSAGIRIAHVSGNGRVHFRHGWWADSASGSYTWIDTEGPMVERFSYDVGGGRLLSRWWEMKLSGLGGEPRESGGVDTLPARLNSAKTERLISAEAANLIGRPLAGRDTTMTFNVGAVLLHTVELRADTVTSSMARNDGLVGTVATVYRKSRPLSFRALWTDSLGLATRYEIDVAGRELRIRGPSGSTADSAPPEAWGIADYAMQEHLVPVLLTLPTEMEVPFAIYRPVGRRWDQLTARIRPLDTGYLIILETKGKEAQYLIVDRERRLLYGENSDPVKAIRAPMPESPLSSPLQKLLEEIKALNPGQESN
jgi:hypothetical protein